MDRENVRRLLERFAAGETTIDAAIESLSSLDTHELGIARLDLHRKLRRGIPEVVFGAGKSRSQLVQIVGALVERRQPVLVTRLAEADGEELSALHPGGEHDAVSRTFVHRPEPSPGSDPPRPLERGLLIVSAGTSDIAVAEEAAVTARCLGIEPEKLYDVGVAGLDRLLSQQETLRRARVVIVVAGMEGALPSVVSGMVASPVIGVPTNVGYGVSMSGLTALFGMLSSCSSGLTVVNVDNGFGAACAARAILSIRE